MFVEATDSEEDLNDGVLIESLRRIIDVGATPRLLLVGGTCIAYTRIVYASKQVTVEKLLALMQSAVPKSTKMTARGGKKFLLLMKNKSILTISVREAHGKVYVHFNIYQNPETFGYRNDVVLNELGDDKSTVKVPLIECAYKKPLSMMRLIFSLVENFSGLVYD